MMTAHRAGSRACSWLIFFAFFFGQKNLASYEALSQQRGNGESVLYGTDGFSDAAFAVPTNQTIDQFWHLMR